MPIWFEEIKGIWLKYWPGVVLLGVVAILSSLIGGTVFPLLAVIGLGLILLITWQPLLGFGLICFFIPLEDLAILFPSFTLIKFVGLVTGWGLLMQLLMGKKTIKLSGFMVALSIYFLWCLFSVVWAIKPDQSISRIFTLGQLMLMFFLGYNLVDHKKQLYFVLGSYLAGSFLAAGLGIYNGYMHDFTTRAVLCNLQNPNLFARLIGLGVLLGLYFFFILKNIRVRLLCFAAALTIFFAFLLTGSRGAWLALFLALVVVLFISGGNLIGFIRKPAVYKKLILVVLVIGLLIPVLANQLPPMITQRIQSFGDISDDRGAGRFDIWLVGLEIAKHNPVGGVGLDNFPYAYTKYLPETDGIVRNIGLNKGPHNIYLATLAELGLPGLFILLYLFRSLWQLSNRTENKQDALLCKLLIVFIAVAGLTGEDQHRKFFWFAMLIPAVMAQFGLVHGLPPAGGAKVKTIFLSFIFPHSQNPNYGIFAFRLVQRLRAAGVAVSVVAPVPYAPAFLWFKKKWRDLGRIPWVEKLEGLEIIHPRYFCWPGYRFDWWNGWFMYWSLYPVLARLQHQKPNQLLHTYGVLPGGFVGLLSSQKLGLASVCTAIGADINVAAFGSKKMTARAGYVLDNTGQVVAVGEDLADKIKQLQKYGNPPMVIYNGVDGAMFNPGRIDPLEAQIKLGLARADRVLLFVGRLIRQKGVYDLIEAFGEIHQQCPEVKLALVGDGEEEEGLRALCRAKGLGEKVIFGGRVPHGEMVYWYAASEMVVLLSHHDGVPNVIKEAMGCGRPVIATRVSGIPELVVEGQTGLLVEPQSFHQATLAMKRLLDDPQWGQQMGQRARELITGPGWKWDDTAQGYLQIYNQLIEKNG